MLIYLQICQLYVLLSSAFCFFWSLLNTRDVVSRLFIRGWGETSDENDIEIHVLDMNLDERT